MSKIESDKLKKIEIWWLLRDIKECGGSKRSTISWGENASHGRIGIAVSIIGEDKYVAFKYTETDLLTGVKESFDYRMPIIETPCNFGGNRHWFRCGLIKDGKECGRRVGVLYKAGDLFGCRHCYELTYASRNRNRYSEMHPILNIFQIFQKQEELRRKIKRYVYAGMPTAKVLRLLKMSARSEKNYRQYLAVEKRRGVNRKNV